MINNKIIRPDISETEEIISKVTNIVDQNININKDYLNYKNNVKSLTNKIIQSKVEGKLKYTSIQELKKYGTGLRYKALEDQGVYSVLDILEYGRSIYNLRGIGDVTGSNILNAAYAMKQEVEDNTYLKLIPNQLNDDEYKLVRLIFFIKNGKEYFEVASNFINSNQKILKENLMFSKKILSSFRWLFSFKETKKSYIENLQLLKGFLNTDLAKEVEKNYIYYNNFIKINNSKSDMVIKDFIQNSADYYSLLESISNLGGKIESNINKKSTSKTLISSDLSNKIAKFNLNKDYLNVTLRGYQEFGAKFALVQKRVLIGDEMGLGKTIEAIAMMSHLFSEGKKHFLVICPASVLINWYREIQKHSTLKPYNVHGTSLIKELKEWKEKGGVAITTYDTFKNVDVNDIDIDLLVADEAHYIKNPYSGRAQAVNLVIDEIDYVIFLTGTPLENKLEEMSQLLFYLNPELMRKVYTGHISEEYRKHVSPLYLRRNREDVLMELPDLIKNNHWTSFSQSELATYIEAVRSKDFMLMRRVAWTTNESKSEKFKRLEQIIEEAKENGHKIIIFSYFLSVINILHENLKDTYGPITGGVSSARRQEIIDSYTKSSPGSILLSQVIAGGIGLNIQAANIVILCEPQIKPSMEDQAISRVYRMGQVNKVIVHKLLSEKSVDERIQEILFDKKEIFDAYARNSFTAETNFEATDTSLKLEKLIIQEEQKRLGIAQ